MKAPLTMKSFLGNARVVEILLRAVENGRLPHALVFAGPAGVGKRTLAILLAQFLNCPAPQGGNACGACGSCRKIPAGTHPDIRLIQPQGNWIRIDQVRSLIGEIAYQPFEARYRVVILDGADQTRQEAANSLLKTLEEPPSRTVIILVTANPYLLLGTIRSRCRILQFGTIPQERIEEYLIEQGGLEPQDARLAALFSNGSLGAAVSFDAERHREVRARALRFLSLLLGQRKFAEFSPLAADVAKDTESFPAWIECVAALLQDIYYAKTAPYRMAQTDILKEITALAAGASHSAVLSAIESVKKLKGAIQQNANRQIALEAMFLIR